ncbi:SAV_2336 N-terminal domain-related protein [Streptomyces sp. NPDC102402]|uniref:SAV_2336 N-terminal domain-related protein n=1 Tax=Streptomyces sp. NPDC102402 TaxID=3366169 RepID=UPI0037F8A774
MPDAAARHGPGGPQDAPTPRNGGPDEPGAGGSGLLPAFVARLRGAGLDPDAEQICDVLWLARQTAGADAPEAPATPGPLPDRTAEALGSVSTHGKDERPAPPGPDPSAPDQDTDGEPDGPPPADPRVALYPVPYTTGVPGRSGGALRSGLGSATVLPLGVPAAQSLPDLLELQRALRPLQRYRTGAPPRRSTLDESATAELSARTGGLVIPVFRGVSRADALLQCVMDASSSMRVWDRMFTELQSIFAQLGAFRDVQVRYLHEGPDGAPAVSRSADPAAAPLHSADRLSDPTGRRVTVVVSDCTGPVWRNGQAHRLLHHLTRQTPTAVLQPLPQRLWNRTRLPVSYGVLSRGDGIGGAATLRVTDESGALLPGHDGSLAVPVLPPVAGALAGWARLLSGTGAGRIYGAVARVRADQPAAPAPRGGARPSSLQLVSRFRSSASPAAGQLAVYLAAAPLCLPVMQLVQRTMLPDSGPSELAEVLLSGLLTRTGVDAAEQGQWYAIEPGVQEALLGSLGRDEAKLVLKHCSEYIEQRFGRAGPNFPALALAQLGDGRYSAPSYPAGPPYQDEADDPGAGGIETDTPGGAPTPPQVPHPFAEVAAQVLKRFMPLPDRFARPDGTQGSRRPDPAGATAVAAARDLVRQFESDGMVQYLIDAVQMLRGATGRERSEPGPALWAEYARCLLRLWEVRGGDELLHEAERAAERAAGHPGAVAERAVLARVLHVAADDRRRRGDRRGALELLRRADREYTVACADPDLDPGSALRLTLERVRALEAQWRLGGDPALLQAAVGMLEAFADVWPDQEDRPSPLVLAHGRVLLRLAGATSDAEQSRVYARQSARSLRTAFEAGAAQHTGDTRTRVLLDLVDALLGCGGDPEEASNLVGQALEAVHDQRMRAPLRARAGRIRVARHEHTGDPSELVLAAAWFERAARSVPRDSRDHADLLAEWGSALLRRAGLPDGDRYIGDAVRVLRDCRTETAGGSPRQAGRLLMLGRALMLRHRATGDPVDLREAEHLFDLAAREARDPLTEAECRLELGRSHLDAYHSLGRSTRLDEAAEAFRTASEAARAAEEELEVPQLIGQAVELAATANHWRGMTYEEAGRPRAARDAYRAARLEWRKLPDAGGPAGESTDRRLEALER